jgi:serpin B
MSSTRALCAVLLLASCSSEVPEPTGKTKDLAAVSTAFAFKLHGEALRQNEGKNVFVSPASVLFALSMAVSGAAGETRDEALAALELKGWKREELEAACSSLLRWLEEGEPGVRLDVANSAWLRQDYPFEPAYSRSLETAYRAQAQMEDFGDPRTLEKMNRWVKDQTRGKIADAGPRAIERTDVLFLINAVYFKGGWHRKFETSATREQPFHGADGTTKSLPFMRRTGRFRYSETSGFQALRIPYGEKDRMAFYVFLPRPGRSLSRLHDDIERSVGNWTPDSAMVELELPRFKLEYEVDLIRVLSAMGMKKAFLPGQADFSGLSPRGRELFIAHVYHKTCVDVNEEGTEAAARTTVAVAGAAEPGRPIPFKVDRPFFCAIADDTSGAILFTGSIVNP